MHTRRIAGVTLAALLMLAACGGSDYSDAVKVNTKFVDAMASYLDDIDKADSASGVVDAIDAYAQQIEKLAPEMKAIAAKHPEWKDLSKLPEELKPIPASFMKSMQYMRDANVQAAHKRLQEAMARMQ